MRFFCLCLCLAFMLGAGRELAAAEIVYPRRPPDSTKIEQMRRGDSTVEPTSATGHELIADLSRWLTHRLVHPPFNGVEPKTKLPGTPEDLETLMQETDRWIHFADRKAKPNKQQLDYSKILGEEMALQLMFIMGETTNKLEKVNAARMLAQIGQLYCEPLADTYLTIIRDSKKFPPEIQLFAFEGLANLLAIPDTDDPNKHFILKTVKLAEIANELSKQATMKHPAGISAEQARVIQFVRRAAVRALAQMKMSTVRQGTDIVARPIIALLRVATNDKYVKPADVALPGYGYQMNERIEALIGICSMTPDRLLNLELLVYLCNDALLELSDFQVNERVQFQKDPRNRPSVAWRIMAYRLNEALRQMKENTKNLPAPRNPTLVATWADLASLKCVSKLEAQGIDAQPDNLALRNWNPAHKPKSNLLISEDESTSFGLK